MIQGKIKLCTVEKKVCMRVGEVFDSSDSNANNEILNNAFLHILSKN